MTAPALCRDCLADVPATGARGLRCHACGSPRVVRHGELHSLSVAHVDCDAFYAAVEKRDNPDLAHVPLIIGGGKRGVVSTACYIARIHGVRSAMPMFKALALCPDAVVLKPNMAISGKKCPKQASVEEVAEKTIRLLKACVPAAVPGIAFLSGGQSDEEATAHLNAMHKLGPLPWGLTFSYGRALQAAPQKAWSGKPENVAAGQTAFSHRARMNGLASKGEWQSSLEQKAA